MKYANAVTFYEQPARLLGSKALFLTSNGIKEQVHGYTITSYKNVEPDNIEYVNTVQLVRNIDTWEKAYDALFGAPSKPQFNSSVLNV